MEQSKQRQEFLKIYEKMLLEDYRWSLTAFMYCCMKKKAAYVHTL